MTLTATPLPLPAWCRTVDEAIATVAKREGLDTEDVKRLLTEGDEL